MVFRSSTAPVMCVQRSPLRRTRGLSWKLGSEAPCQDEGGVRVLMDGMVRVRDRRSRRLVRRG